MYKVPPKQNAVSAISDKILIYKISLTINAFWLILTYDLLEDRRIADPLSRTFNCL